MFSTSHRSNTVCPLLAKQGCQLGWTTIVQSFEEAREGGRQILAYDWESDFGGDAHRGEFFENYPPLPPSSSLVVHRSKV